MMDETRGRHRGIDFIIKEADEPGFCCFEFEIAGEFVRGRVETRLVRIAARRAQRTIDRKLKQMQIPPP
jgi:hypothetical protein